jgi:2-iminobutanoate/2-iminopropanoate deaminase
MERKIINAPDAPSASGGYAQAVEISGASRFLIVSGQIPLTVDGVLPATFTEQCRVAWANVGAQLRAADMSLDNLVKVTTYLSSREYAAENRAVREAVLAGRSPALTVIVAGIFDEAWLVEIEAMAVA